MLTWVLRQSPPSSMTCGSQTCDQKDRTCYCICLRLPDQISSGEYQPSGHHCAHHIAAKRASAAGVGSAGAGCRQGGMQMADPVSCCNLAGWHANRVRRVRRTALHSPEPGSHLQQPRYGSQMHTSPR